MKYLRKVVFEIFLLLFAPLLHADMYCGAVEYKCDLEKKQVLVKFIGSTCGSASSPFNFENNELTGLYDADDSKLQIVKNCKLGTTPIQTVIINSCAPRVWIYRGNLIEIDKVGNNKTLGNAIIHAPMFGYSCGPSDDKRTMTFTEIVVNYTNVDSIEKFTVEMK